MLKVARVGARVPTAEGRCVAPAAPPAAHRPPHAAGPHHGAAAPSLRQRGSGRRPSRAARAADARRHEAYPRAQPASALVTPRDRAPETSLHPSLPGPHHHPAVGRQPLEVPRNPRCTPAAAHPHASQLAPGAAQLHACPAPQALHASALHAPLLRFACLVTQTHPTPRNLCAAAGGHLPTSACESNLQSASLVSNLSSLAPPSL